MSKNYSYREQLTYLLNTQDKDKIEALFFEIHPADLAEAFTELSTDERQDILPYMDTILSKESLAAVLTELPSSLLNETIEHIFACAKHKHLEEAIASLDSDDIVWLLEDLREKYQDALIQSLPKAQKKHVTTSLSFPEDSAGRMMQQEFITFDQNDTVHDVLQGLKSSRGSAFYDLYVTDSESKVVGFVRACELLKHHNLHVTMSHIMEDHTPIAPDVDQENVIQLFKKYALMSAPVIGHDGKMLGMITADDVVYVMDEEADEDVRFLGGILQETAPGLSVWQASYHRIQWLVVTFVNTLIASSVLYQFESTLSKYVALAILMPTVASMGGNVGMQVVTLMIRFLATQSNNATTPNHWWSTMTRMLSREVKITTIIGVLFSCLITVVTSLWFDDLHLGCILGAAMLFNIVWAGCVGTFFPLAIHRLGFDPAISSGPFVTTLTDITGFSVFLGLAKLFLLS